MTTAGSSDPDTMRKQLGSDANEAGAPIEKLKQTRRVPRLVLSAAFSESRKAFDKANQTA